MECDFTGLDSEWCEHCLHPPAHGPKRTIRHIPRSGEEDRLVSVKGTRPDPDTLRAQQILMGYRCGVCGHLREGSFGSGTEGTDTYRQGMCWCERQARFEREKDEVLQWHARLKGEGRKASQWPMMQGMRRATLKFGRDEPAEYLTEPMPLVAAIGFLTRTAAQEPARWSKPRGGGDDLPV